MEIRMLLMSLVTPFNERMQAWQCCYLSTIYEFGWSVYKQT